MEPAVEEISSYTIVWIESIITTSGLLVFMVSTITPISVSAKIPDAKSASAQFYLACGFFSAYIQHVS